MKRLIIFILYLLAIIVSTVYLMTAIVITLKEKQDEKVTDHYGINMPSDIRPATGGKSQRTLDNLHLSSGNPVRYIL